MGCALCGILNYVFIGFIAFVTYKIYVKLFKPKPIPKLNTKKYWGAGEEPAEGDCTEVKSFKIKASEDQLKKLKEQLSDTDFLRSPLEDSAFKNGFNADKLKKIAKYWRDEYLPKWSSQEQFLNKFPQFTTKVQGLDIHFIHAKPIDNGKLESKRVIPLLILHGWPGSIREFYEVIPKLITPNDENDFVFEVIAPSLPGYGWSQGASKGGFGSLHYATVLRNLMLKLNFDRFLVQGGDWGSIIGNQLTTLYPENVIGYHSNMCLVSTPLAFIKMLIASLFPSRFVKQGLEDFHFPILPQIREGIRETGYFHINATKPETVGIAVGANPLGLAAYILEKFSTAVDKDNRSDSEGGLDKTFTMDSLLDNLMIYYLSNAFQTSVRIYHESFKRSHTKHQIDRVKCSVPMGCVRFKNDLHAVLDWVLKDKFTNVIHSTYHRGVGHFAALENPDLFYEDFVQFVRKI